MLIDALYRGRFNAWDSQRPSPRAVAVSGGRIVAFDDEAEALSKDAVSKDDFGRAAIFPGFHDAHCHTTSYGVELDQLDLSSPPIRSLDDLYEAVAAWAAALPPDGFVVGSRYDQNKIGGRHPDRFHLDRAAGGRPVWLKHTSGHMCTVNSATLELIGAQLGTLTSGGAVVRDEAGEPTGLLEEGAQSLVQRLVLPRSTAELSRAIGRAHELYLEEGITSVCDAGIGGGFIGQSPLELAAYQRARDEGRLRVRSTVMLSAELLGPAGGHAEDFAAEARAAAAGLRSGLGDEWLRIGPVKVFSDGSLIGRTCCMEEDFSDSPGNRGYLQAAPEELRALIVGAHLAGWQVATHAIGDRAVSFTIDCYEEALRRLHRPDHRLRIEHCGVTTDQSLHRIGALGIVPVPQGRFVGEIGDGMAAALGEERSPLAYRLASFLRAGIVLPGSSDRPVVDGAPLKGIADMVRRRTESGRPFGQHERLSAEEALRAYSAGSAFAERSEASRGSLRLGQLADFVALEADPRSLEPAEIANVKVLATVVGGVIGFDAR